MGITNLLEAETIEKSQVNLLLVGLKSRNSLLSMVNCQEVYQLFIILNLLLHHFNLLFHGHCLRSLGSFRFPEVCDCCFTSFQGLNGFLIINYLLFSCNLMLHDEFSSLKTIKHSLQIKEFRFDPNERIFVGISLFVV